MRIPRDLSGPELARLLGTLGYTVTRQTGSHMRLTTAERGEHHVTVPRHDALRVGTLSAILADVADHFSLTRAELSERLFGTKRP
jgi:predicted RNA binding protein YcfA (HicA-like mRNA interferase family)